MRNLHQDYDCWVTLCGLSLASKQGWLEPDMFVCVWGGGLGFCQNESFPFASLRSTLRFLIKNHEKNMVYSQNQALSFEKTHHIAFLMKQWQNVWFAFASLRSTLRFLIKNNEKTWFIAKTRTISLRFASLRSTLKFLIKNMIYSQKQPTLKRGWVGRVKGLVWRKNLFCL